MATHIHIHHCRGMHLYRPLLPWSNMAVQVLSVESNKAFVTLKTSLRIVKRIWISCFTHSCRSFTNTAEFKLSVTLNKSHPAKPISTTMQEDSRNCAKNPFPFTQFLCSLWTTGRVHWTLAVQGGTKKVGSPREHTERLKTGKLYLGNPCCRENMLQFPCGFCLFFNSPRSFCDVSAS